MARSSNVHSRPTILLLFLAICCSCGASERSEADCATQPAASQAVEETVLDEVITACEADDGPCAASSECTGTVEGRDCTPEGVLPSSAATCTAANAGLAPGLEDYEATLVYNARHRRIVWIVSTVTVDRGPGDRAGESYAVDAKTGEVLDKSQWRETA